MYTQEMQTKFCERRRNVRKNIKYLYPRVDAENTNLSATKMVLLCAVNLLITNSSRDGGWKLHKIR